MADKITLEKAKSQIVSAIKQRGPFSHNIVSIVLRMVASAHGAKAANDLIVEFNLTKRYGIYVVVEDKENVSKKV